MAKLKDNFNKKFNKHIFIEGGKDTLDKKDKETAIELSSNGKTIRVTKDNGNWPSNIKIEVEVDETYKVDVSKPQNCTIKKCKFVNNENFWCITPSSKKCKCFCFDLSVINENIVPMDDIGATVTVGDEGDAGEGKKRKRRRS